MFQRTLAVFALVAATAWASKGDDFSEESCKAMFETKKKLGGSVPPNDFVTGCTEVCASAKAMKEYWGSGDMATYACEQVAKFGCVWDGAPPVTASGIGC